MNKKRSFVSVVLSLFVAFSMICSSVIPAMAAEVDTSDYDAFVANLEVLEDYAHDYVQTKTSENEIQIVMNYVRTGVAKYTTSSWQILAGAENTAFTQYVAEKDAENNTTASALKSILDEYTISNGDIIDLRHMFGSMDVAYYSMAQGASTSLVQARADLSSWAGDVCDLMLVSGKDNSIVSEDFEEYVSNIYNKYLGEDYDYAFGQDDIYGDLDAFYILDQLNSSDKRISQVMREYFTETLTDEMRVDYFVTNRFNGVRSRNDIRLMVYRAYTKNQLMYTLECSRSLQNKHELRTACLYAFADYLFLLAGDPDAPDTVGEEEEPASDNEYYSVFNTASSNLAPGIKQEIKYAISKDNKQMVYYIANIDINRDDVNIYANYNNNDPTAWAMSRTTDQMAAIQAKHTNPEDTENYVENYNVILGTNADFYNMSNGKPSGALVMNGVQYCEHNYRADRGFFAILKDGTPVIGSGTDWDEVAGDVQEAVGGSVVLIRHGEVVDANISDYYGNRAPRTCVGITVEGKIVLMVLDGRQEPFSAGGNTAEIAQIMLDAGCVEAINLDGGGSSTFAAKQEGADEVTIVNRPSDGYERSVSSSLVVVSTAEPSNKFDHVLVETATDYLTVNSSLPLTLNGVSTTGNSAEIPENTVYQLSDNSVGHIENDVFYADREGVVELSVYSDGAVIGTKTLNVVTPDRVFFSKTSMDVIYGKSITLPINASYNGNAVTINSGDIFFQLSNNKAGTFDGFDFHAAEDSGLNNITVTAMLSADFAIKAMISLSIYEEGAAIFDFDNAMYGDRMLSWNRYVTNSTTRDNKVYYIVKEGEDMTAEYTFGIDMRSVPIPSQLLDLLYMVAGGDVDGVSAWMFLLQLAERVSPLTHVSVSMNFTPDVEVDISNITVVSDYFTLENPIYDPIENKLTLEAYWIKQSAAIPEDTANPICIVSGIKVTPRDTAYWENGNDLIVPITGKLHYWIGLRTSQLYNMSQDPAFQQMYGIYDYDNSANLANDKGGFFEMDYLDFDDTYQLNKEIKQGWRDFYDGLYYFVDNAPLTGIQKLPDRDNPEIEYFYDLGDNGICRGKVSGLFELDGDTYYAINGVPRIGWFAIDADNYYFDAEGRAVDGEQTIDGYHFLFENNILKEGQFVKDGDRYKYRWADSFMIRSWFEYQGKTYYVNSDRRTEKGLTLISLSNNGYSVHLFDDDGSLIHTYTDEGLVTDGDLIVYVKDGVAQYQGLVQAEDGSIYYINSTRRAVKDCTYSITAAKTNGILPAGTYQFGPDGKLIVENTEAKNGLCFDDDGEIRYYVNGVAQYQGLVQAEDGSIYYINSSKKAVKNCSYAITAAKTNGILPAGTYEFGADGKLIVVEAERVWISSDTKGTASSFGVGGADVYAVNAAGEVIAQTLTNDSNDYDECGKFSILVPASTTQLYVGNPSQGADTIVNRGFTVSGFKNVSNVSFAVVTCDYNDDGYINIVDKANFNGYLKGEYNSFADFNGDGFVNVVDKACFNGLLKTGSEGVVYEKVLSF